MIEGIGIDIVEISRIEKSLAKKGFLEKVYSKEEIQYCQKMTRPQENFAGRFAAKEAFLKALGKVSYNQFEISQVKVVNDKNGKPNFNLEKEFFNKYPILNDADIHLSISHSKSYAIAMVMIEKMS